MQVEIPLSFYNLLQSQLQSVTAYQQQQQQPSMSSTFQLPTPSMSMPTPFTTLVSSTSSLSSASSATTSSSCGAASLLAAISKTQQQGCPQHSQSRSRHHQQQQVPAGGFNSFGNGNLADNVDLSKSKAEFVESLVDTSASIIESVWPNHSFSARAKLLPLRKFIHEILRRSRTSFYTLQLSLLYIIRLRNELVSGKRTSSSFASCTPSSLSASSKQIDPSKPHPSLCGRRMFLSSLIVAAKYLQDRNYSNRAWSKISGLPLSEINANEMEFLKMIDYDLFVNHRTFGSWSGMIVNRTQQRKKEREVARERERAGAGGVPSVLLPLPSPPLPLPSLPSVHVPVLPQAQQPCYQSKPTTIPGIGAIPSPSTLSVGVSSFCGSPSPVLVPGILSSSSTNNVTVIANGTATAIAATGGLPATSSSSSDYPSPAVSTAGVRAGLKRGFSEMSEASSEVSTSECEDATSGAVADAVSLVNQLCGSFDGQEFVGAGVNGDKANNKLDLSYDAVERFLASFGRSNSFNGEQSIEGMLGDVNSETVVGFEVEMESCGLLSMMEREVVKRVRVE
ncbi:hypothetical protein HDU76_012326 [Blyttiomyces sp. JEL0837]|nr:hypothetical protein HDU76_012326 [Blyttiomyces sp. JEL0837]